MVRRQNMSFIKTSIIKFPQPIKIVDFEEVCNNFNGKQLDMQEYNECIHRMSIVLTKKDYKTFCKHFRQVPGTTKMEFVK